MSTDESSYLFDWLFPCILFYFNSFVLTAKGSPEQAMMACSIMQHLGQLFDVCAEEWQKGEVAEVGRLMLQTDIERARRLQMPLMKELGHTSTLENMIAFLADSSVQRQEFKESRMQLHSPNSGMQNGTYRSRSGNSENKFHQSMGRLKDNPEVMTNALTTTLALSLTLTLSLSNTEVPDGPLISISIM